MSRRSSCREPSTAGSTSMRSTVGSSPAFWRAAWMDRCHPTRPLPLLPRSTVRVCRERQHLADLATLGPYAGHIAGAAVAIALVTPDPAAADAPLSVMFDLGQAAENMMLAALELGIGSCPATVYQHDRARELLGYPLTHHCEYVLSFGYPADPAELSRPPRTGGRRPLSEIVHEERWSSSG